MRWILLLALCGCSEPSEFPGGPDAPAGPEVLPEPAVGRLTGRKKRDYERHFGRKSKSRDGVRCKRIELDHHERWNHDSGHDSEAEYLRAACYQDHRFFLEHIWCMYGTTDTFRIPRMTMDYYPCLFSTKYEVEHGSIGRDENGRLKWRHI